MQFIKKDKANYFKNSETCEAYEYKIEEKDLNIAVAELNGRYPINGRVVNAVCKEIVYVTDGDGELVIEGKKVKFEKGDVIFLEPNERYYWNGKASLAMICHPAWYPEQHKEVE